MKGMRKENEEPGSEPLEDEYIKYFHYLHAQSEFRSSTHSLDSLQSNKKQLPSGKKGSKKLLPWPEITILLKQYKWQASQKKTRLKLHNTVK